MKSDLFLSEKLILEDAKINLLNNSFNFNSYNKLLKAYEKLLKQTRRLVRMSDRSEEEIRRLSKEESILNKTLNEQNNRLEALSTKLSKYLSPQVYESIFSGKSQVKVGADRKFLTIFFSDIASFTDITDQLEPEILTKALNAYLDEMANVAINHGATIDKYIGDSVMAFMGDPKTEGQKIDAIKCVKMALVMQENTHRLNFKLEKLGVSRPFHIRCGINSGFCTVGNFGSENRLDYTAIGNNVNLASRLESNAEIGEVLISEETKLLIEDDFECLPKEKIQVKGFSRPIQTYSVLKYNNSHHSIPISYDMSGVNIEIDKSQIPPEMYDSLKNLINEIDVLLSSRKS